MSEPKTYYGEWIHRPMHEEEYPLIPYALWETQRVGEMGLTSVEVSDEQGIMEDDGDITRLRRVYPPGSVLPEPREVISMNRSVVLGWKHWMLLDQQESYPRWESREDAVYLPGFLGYPVQPLQNGAFVPVPWSAVGVVK